MHKATLLTKGIVARFGRPSPLVLTFELSHRCNLACVYCDRHTPMPQEMSRDDIFRVLDEFIALGMWKINLDGGEPLSLGHIDDIVAWLTAHEVATHMHTNGILAPAKIRTVQRLAGVRISLDGLQEHHDAMRGPGSFEHAIKGAVAARDAGVPKVEFTCVVGRHNAHALEALIDLVEELGCSIVFQPARNSLFLDTERDGAAFQLQAPELRDAFARIEQRKRHSPAVGNQWSSLRHFRTFPQDTPLPCAAGWISVTMDPAGNLYHCGQVNRRDPSINVLRLGVRQAFKQMPRYGCTQCWCARTVEGNYQWGARVDKMVPIDYDAKAVIPHPWRQKKKTVDIENALCHRYMPRFQPCISSLKAGSKKGG